VLNFTFNLPCTNIKIKHILLSNKANSLSQSPNWVNKDVAIVAIADTSPLFDNASPISLPPSLLFGSKAKPLFSWAFLLSPGY
jgi:hypothetical protein